MLSDYGHLLSADPDYAERAGKIADLATDMCSFLSRQDLDALDCDTGVGPVAVHAPCTLYHGLGEPNTLESLLSRIGFELAPTTDKHLCCGSAGTYSILEPKLSQQLRERKLANLTAKNPDVIVTANVGCQTHLAGSETTPVRHWLELLAEDLDAGRCAEALHGAESCAPHRQGEWSHLGSA